MIHAFKFKELNLVLDVETSALHLVDDTAFEVISMMERGGDIYALPYPERQIREIEEEVKTLQDAGSLNTPEAQVPKGISREQVIKSMCLHIAHDCNLRCRYCFADSGEYQQGHRALMSAEVGKKALDFLMEHSGRRHNLEVDLFGGEPLMNFSVVQEIVSYGRALEQRFDKHINFTITTNGVGLAEDVIQYLNREMFNIVLSLDGRKEVHDFMRPTPNGKGSYDLCIDKIKRMVQVRDKDRDYYVRGTFTNRNLDFTEDVKHFVELGFDQLSLEPVVLPEESPYAIREEHVQAVLTEYDRLADYMIESRKNGKWFNFFHFMIDLSGGPCLKKRIAGCGAGMEYVAVTPEGDIYPCHQFVGMPEMKMGSVLAGEPDQGIRKKFAACTVLSKPKCRDCWAKYFCSGGCAANAYKYNGDIAKPYEMTCKFLKKRTEIAVGLYAIENMEGE